MHVEHGDGGTMEAMVTKPRVWRRRSDVGCEGETECVALAQTKHGGGAQLATAAGPRVWCRLSPATMATLVG